MKETVNLDRICGVYRELDNEEKGKIIRLAEVLLDDQKSASPDKIEQFELRNT